MHAFAFTCVLVCVTMVSLLVVTSCADINGHTRTHIKGPIYYIPPHTQHPPTHTHAHQHEGSSRFDCEVLPHFLFFTLWSHCYHNLLSGSNTCHSQPLHSAVVGGGGPDGGSRSVGEKEVGWLCTLYVCVCMCVCVCVCVCVLCGCVGVCWCCFVLCVYVPCADDSILACSKVCV